MVAAAFVVNRRGGNDAFAQAVWLDRPNASESNAVASMTGCSSQAETWLAPVARRLSRCMLPTGEQPYSSGSVGQVGAWSLGVCDVNSDGTPEYFDSVNDRWGRVVVLGDGDANGPILLRSSSEPAANGSMLLVQNPVLVDSPELLASLRALYASAQLTNAEITPRGWRDVDHDGDQDLICTFTFNVWQVGTPLYMDIWFENLTSGSPPANPYDLDHDGHVNNADLSLLLMEFTD